MVGKLKIVKADIPGCYEIFPILHKDDRGLFSKVFNTEWFVEYGLDHNFAEQYYSLSYKGTLRGLHFQTPPFDHVKYVYCPSGRVLDVVLDLRVGSPTYKEHRVFELTSEKGNALYIPKGLAHGFYVLSEQALLVYNVTTVYSAEHDTGILWNSADISWPNKEPIISARDLTFPALEKFQSPFIF